MCSIPCGINVSIDEIVQFSSLMPYARGDPLGVAEPLAPPLTRLEYGQVSGRGRPREGPSGGDLVEAKTTGLCHILFV